MRTILMGALVTILLAFLAAFSFSIFDKLFVKFDPVVSAPAAGAFLGAFFAFLFVRIADFLRAYADRTTKHYDTLVRIEYKLNSLTGELDDNIFVIDTFNKNFEESTKRSDSGYLFVWGNRLEAVELFGDLPLGLTNIDLLNELFMMDVHLRKLNSSLVTLNSTYEEAKDAMLGKKITPENYLMLLRRTQTNLNELRGFLNEGVIEAVSALAAVRVLARNRPLQATLMRILPGRKFGRNFGKLRELEKQKLLLEMSEIKLAGKSRIDRVLDESGKAIE